MKKQKNVPELRFSEFSDKWKIDRLDYFVTRCVDSVDVQLTEKYKQIGIRSHGKGIFHKEPVTGEALGNKRVFWVHSKSFVVNIVFAWEQAVALTSNNEEGFIASHRFLMYLSKENRTNLEFLLLFFLRKRGKYLLELASPGGAGRNKTLGLQSFADLEVILPSIKEQEKIANFLSAVDKKLSQLRRNKELLETYKRGLMQKLFSQQIRFNQDDGTAFPDWKEKKIEDIFEVTRGQVLAMPKTTAEPTGNNIYPVYSSQTKNNGLAGYYNEYLFENAITWTTDGANAGETKYRSGKFYCTNVCGVLLNLEGYANTFIAELINSVSRKYVSYVGNPKLMNNVMAVIKLQIPDVKEQQKIANCLTALNKKIEAVAQQIHHTEQFKKGLLQKMFV